MPKGEKGALTKDEAQSLWQSWGGTVADQEGQLHLPRLNWNAVEFSGRVIVVFPTLDDCAARYEVEALTEDLLRDLARRYYLLHEDPSGRNALERIAPIRPEEVAANKARTVPDWVIDEWNKLITRKWDGERAHFTLNELRDAVVERWLTEDPLPGGDPQQEPNRSLHCAHGTSHGYFALLPLYREHGWAAEWDGAVSLTFKAAK